MKEKEIVTQVSIKSGNPNWNPVFNSLKVGPDDEGGGSLSQDHRRRY